MATDPQAGPNTQADWLGGKGRGGRGRSLARALASEAMEALGRGAHTRTFVLRMALAYQAILPAPVLASSTKSKGS